MERKSDGHHEWMIDQYTNHEMSSHEICESMEKTTGIKITPRQVQRILKSHGVPMRNAGDALRLAAKKGRVVWRLKKHTYRKRISQGARYRVLVRDNGVCQTPGCGARENLTIDHKVALVHGGTDDEENLWVLCWDCNRGKKETNHEYPKGSIMSGKTAR